MVNHVGHSLSHGLGRKKEFFALYSQLLYEFEVTSKKISYMFVSRQVGLVSKHNHMGKGEREAGVRYSSVLVFVM